MSTDANHDNARQLTWNELLLEFRSSIFALLCAGITEQQATTEVLTRCAPLIAASRRERAEARKQIAFLVRRTARDLACSRSVKVSACDLR